MGSGQRARSRDPRRRREGRRPRARPRHSRGARPLSLRERPLDQVRSGGERPQLVAVEPAAGRRGCRPDGHGRAGADSGHGRWRGSSTCAGRRDRLRAGRDRRPRGPGRCRSSSAAGPARRRRWVIVRAPPKTRRSGPTAVRARGRSRRRSPERSAAGGSPRSAGDPRWHDDLQLATCLVRLTNKLDDGRGAMVIEAIKGGDGAACARCSRRSPSAPRSVTREESRP